MFILKVVNALNKNGVDYAVAGGYAVALHGAVRGTVDIDIIVNISKRSLKNTEDALKMLGLESKLPVTAEEVYNFRDEYISNRNMISWGFVNPVNPAEVVDIIITEDLKKLSTKTVNISGTDVKIISIYDLIRIKDRSNRAQDIEDAKALRKLAK